MIRSLRAGADDMKPARVTPIGDDITGILKRHNISIGRELQSAEDIFRERNEECVNAVITTLPTEYDEMKKALNEIQGLGWVVGDTFMMRAEEY